MQWDKSRRIKEVIASPCPFGARALRCRLRQIAHSAALLCDRTMAVTMHPLPNAIALSFSFVADEAIFVSLEPVFLQNVVSVMQ